MTYRFRYVECQFNALRRARNRNQLDVQGFAYFTKVVFLSRKIEVSELFIREDLRDVVFRNISDRADRRRMVTDTLRFGVGGPTG
jgi:hypothetical protein